MIRGLVFDFDGLILETESPAFQAWAELFQEHGVSLELDWWFDYIGRESGWVDVHGHLETLLGHELDRAAIKARRDARKEELIHALDVIVGVREWVMEAKSRGLRLGIASSSPRSWVCGHLERLAFMEHWDAIVCREDVARAKPEPDLFLRAVERLGISPGEAIAIEDSPNGIRAAKAAGLACIAVPNQLTRQRDLGEADLLLESLSDLPLADALARFA